MIFFPHSLFWRGSVNRLTVQIDVSLIRLAGLHPGLSTFILIDCWCKQKSLSLIEIYLQISGATVSRPPSGPPTGHQTSSPSQTIGESTWTMVSTYVDHVFVTWLSCDHNCLADGEWVKVDETHAGLKGSRNFFETRDFLVDPAAPSNLVVELCIKIPGKYTIITTSFRTFRMVIPCSRNHYNLWLISFSVSRAWC